MIILHYSCCCNCGFFVFFFVFLLEKSVCACMSVCVCVCVREKAGERMGKCADLCCCKQVLFQVLQSDAKSDAR